MDSLRRAVRTVTGPSAQRTYLGIFLFTTTSLALLCVAALAYPVFYYFYIPQKLVSIPIHLQYNAGLNPYGVTHLASNLVLEQEYDVSVELTVPRSPSNVERGNFMVAMFVLKSLPDNPAYANTVPSDPYEHVVPDNIIFSSRRPAIVPYKDPLVSAASRLLFLLYHIFFPESEQITLSVPMGELVEFRKVLPLSVLLDVQAGQSLHVYSVTITLIARLSGLRWIMYNHRIFSFAVFTTAFWLCEMAAMGFAWLMLLYATSSGHDQPRPLAASTGKNTILSPKKAMGLTGFGTHQTAAESSQGDDMKREDEGYGADDGGVTVKRESPESQLPLEHLSRTEADADDEGDGEDVRKGAASTGIYDGKGTVLRRRSSRGGITSL